MARRRLDPSDLSFDLERDIICTSEQTLSCRGPRPENGVVNAGAIIVKSGPFSLAFETVVPRLYRKAGMDQHIFDEYIVVKVERRR